MSRYRRYENFKMIVMHQKHAKNLRVACWCEVSLNTDVLAARKIS